MFYLPKIMELAHLEDVLSVVNRLIVLVGRVFASGLGDRGSIPDQVIPKAFLKNGTWYLLA